MTPEQMEEFARETMAGRFFDRNKKWVNDPGIIGKYNVGILKKATPPSAVTGKASADLLRKQGESNVRRNPARAIGIAGALAGLFGMPNIGSAASFAKELESNPSLWQAIRLLDNGKEGEAQKYLWGHGNGPDSAFNPGTDPASGFCGYLVAQYGKEGEVMARFFAEAYKRAEAQAKAGVQPSGR